MDEIFLVNSASFQDFELSSSLRAGPNSTIDFIQAATVTGSFSGRGDQLTLVSASYIVPNQNTSASYATISETAHSIDFVPSTSNSASWVSASAEITTADTASYIDATNVAGTVASSAQSLNSTQSLFATQSINAFNSTQSLNATQSLFATQSLSSVQSVYATQSLDATQSLFATQSLASIQSTYATQSLSSTQSIFATSSLTATSASWASASISSSYALSASYAITSSYAITASYLTDYVYSILSGSNNTNNTISHIATSMSFIINPSEIWICEAHCVAQSNSNRGMRYSISSSAATLGAGAIGGTIFSNDNALTAIATGRITTVNSIVATTIHRQANTPGMDMINFSIINPSSPSTISIAFGVTNVADTATVFAGSYLVARRVR